MIRTAKMDDMDQILSIVNRVIVLMQKEGNDQWNDSYPSQRDFQNDIEKGELFVDVESEGKIKALVCLNRCEPEEYKTVKWRHEKPSLVIHRMAVAPEYHGKGLARKLFCFAEKHAKKMNLDYLRSDTCSKNTGMNYLFGKLEYNHAGTIRLPGFKYDYKCYEKDLSA